jgi:hypothetical protein
VQRRHHQGASESHQRCPVPRLNYLARLQKHMDEAGFPGDDKLYLLVSKAYDAMRHLSSEVHYMTCDGVGRPARKE